MLEWGEVEYFVMHEQVVSKVISVAIRWEGEVTAILTVEIWSKDLDVAMGS
jgi:hypothetical protein